jgi:hypothetical protein
MMDRKGERYAITKKNTVFTEKEGEGDKVV